MTLCRITRRSMVGGLAAWAALSAVAARAAPADLPGGLRLIFVDDAACGYCRKWMKEVGARYDETPPGKIAPLVRRSMGDASLSAFAGLKFTPTFILVRDGREIDRMIGYGGIEEFWQGLAAMLAKAELGKEPRRKGPGAPVPDGV